jgi:hypothetical protein
MAHVFDAKNNWVVGSGNHCACCDVLEDSQAIILDHHEKINTARTHLGIS